MQHQWSFELWSPEQMAIPAGTVQGCAQVPGKTGRLFAPDSRSAREQAAEIAAGTGSMVGAGQHFRYDCCKLPDGTYITQWLTASGQMGDGILAYGKDSDGYLVAVRTKDGIRPAGRKAGF